MDKQSLRRTGLTRRGALKAGMGAALGVAASLESIDLTLQETSEGWFVHTTLPTIEAAGSAEQIEAAIEWALTPSVPAPVHAIVRGRP